jgi:putative transposase
MNKSKVTHRSRKDRATWLQLIQEKEQSGQSVKEFCRVRGIKAATWYAWRKRIKRTQAGDEVPLFSPIEIQTKPGSGVVVELPGGVVLRLGELPPAEYLCRLSVTFSGI